MSRLKKRDRKKNDIITICAEIGAIVGIIFGVIWGEVLCCKRILRK